MKADCANCKTHACYTKGVNCTGMVLTGKQSLTPIMTKNAAL